METKRHVVRLGGQSGHEGEFTVLAFLAAALAATTPSNPSAVLESAQPWWERITVTVDHKGEQQSCLYEASISPGGAEACDEKMAASVQAAGDRREGLYSKLTFERRFSPGGRLDAGRVQPGDTLLGRQVMFLTFDENGSIASCDIVAASGDLAPDYDCAKVRKEQFRAQASAEPGARQAFMTLLAYGHTEQIV